MRKYLIIVPLGVLASCAAKPSIHIFSLGIEKQDLEAIIEMLEEVGFDARPNTLPVPPSFIKHTVIFPAITQDFGKIELVTGTLANAGYNNPRLILETDSNHSYSTNNIGVYLIHPDFRNIVKNLDTDPYSLGSNEANPFSFNYFSECPKGSESQSELNLFPSGVAILEEFVWNEKSNNEISVLHDGEWSFASPSLQVDLSRKGELRYSINRYSGSNWLGPYEGLTLRNEYSTVEFEACDYTHLNYTDD